MSNTPSTTETVIHSETHNGTEFEVVELFRPAYASTGSYTSHDGTERHYSHDMPERRSLRVKYSGVLRGWTALPAGASFAHRLNKVRAKIDNEVMLAALLPQVQAVCGDGSRGTAKGAAFGGIGAVVGARAFNAIRRGIVTKQTKTKTTVAYVTPSNPGEVRETTVPTTDIWA